MTTSLRIQAVALPVRDVAAVERFYRWVLAMKEAATSTTSGVALGWGQEDRIEFVDAAEGGAQEVVVLRLSTMTAKGLIGWLVDRGLTPETSVVPTAHEGSWRATWPGTAIEVGPESRIQVRLRGEVEPRIDLVVPLEEPAPEATRMETTGPRGLEVPGLLGITTGAPDARAARDYLALFGIEPLEPGGDSGPLRVGDQQWIVEEREPAGIYGIAAVIELDRIKDLVRTLERLGADHRHERNRLIALDPGGRVLMVHGLKGG